MRILMSGLLCAAFLFLALNSGAAPQLTIPRNIRFLVRVVSPLDTSKLKVGDLVQFELVTNVRGMKGEVVIPAGAHFRGKIARVASLSSGEAQLAVLLTEVAWDGQNAKLVACFNQSQPREVQPASTAEGLASTWSNLTVRDDPAFGAIITSKVREVVLPAGTELYLQQCELPTPVK